MLEEASEETRAEEPQQLGPRREGPSLHPLPLLVAERAQRVDGRRSACWKIAGRQRHKGDDHRDGAKRQRVLGRDLKEQASDDARERVRSCDTDDQAATREGRALGLLPRE